jgi:REP element-mobilizing transposase RayT
MKIRKRILIDGVSAVYHVISRTAYQSFLFEDQEKEVFTRMLFQQAEFAGVNVLGFCIMSNHIHLLLRVSPVESLDNKSLLQRYKRYYGSNKVPQSTYAIDELKKILGEGGVDAETARNRILSRMGDLPSFMRELKQRFTIWYNHKHENKGTIWAARYKSLIVEDSPESLTRVAAYIDLNPVRANIVEDPKDYRWCGYARALAGRRCMRSALIQLFAQKHTYALALQSYRLILFGKGYESKGTISSDTGRISAEKLEQIIKTGGNIPSCELLRYRIRYFSDGLVLGSQSYVESVFQTHRSSFGKNRPVAGTSLSSGTWGSLCTLRNLKLKVYTECKQ